MRPLLTAEGEGNEGSHNDSPKYQIPFQQMLQTTFKSEETANEIHSMLTDMELDLQDLMDIDANDLNDLCQDMQLKGATKIKFKSFIKRQKRLQKSANTSQTHIVTAISQKEQKAFNTVETALKQSNDLQHLFETHFNEIESHTIGVTAMVNQRFGKIFEALKLRQKALNNTISKWKLDKLDEINSETSKISANTDALNELKTEMNDLLTKGKSVMGERERKIEGMTQKYFENNTYYKILNDTQLLQIYLEKNTKLLNVKFQDRIAMNELNTFGSVNVSEMNSKYGIPSIVLANISVKNKGNKGFAVNIECEIQNRNECKENEREYLLYFSECNKEQKMSENWQKMRNIKVKTESNNGKLSIESGKCLKYNKLYKFKIECVMTQPFSLRIDSNIKEFVCINNNMNIDLKNAQKIKLSVRSHKGHACDYKPQNLLLSNDDMYISQEGVNYNDWIIFQNKGNQKYNPTQIEIRGYNSSRSIKEFNLWIGDYGTNEWIKLNQTPFMAQQKEGMQSFRFEICEKWKRVQKNGFAHYKLEILNNYGSSSAIIFYEFKLFGVEI